MKLVEEGHNEPHRAEYAIIKSCVINGWSEHEAWRLLTDFLHPGGKALQDIAAKNLSRAQTRFNRTWDKATKEVSSRSRPVYEPYETFAALADIALAADSIAWSGRSGPTDRLVLDGLLAQAWSSIRMNGLLVGVRQMADHVGISKTQAANALTRLASGPFVSRSPRKGGYRYDLHLPSAAEADEVPDQLARLSQRAAMCAPGTYGNLQGGVLTCPRNAHVARTLGAHDVWRIPGLSGNPRRIFAIIEAAPMITTAQITSFMKVHRTTVTRGLDRLHSAGLVDQKEGQWCRTQVSLDELAIHLGADGRLEQQAQRHRQERQIYQTLEQIKLEAFRKRRLFNEQVEWFSKHLPDTIVFYVEIDGDKQQLTAMRWLYQHPEDIPAFLRGQGIPDIAPPHPDAKAFASHRLHLAA